MLVLKYNCCKTFSHIFSLLLLNVEFFFILDNLQHLVHFHFIALSENYLFISNIISLAEPSDSDEEYADMYNNRLQPETRESVDNEGRELYNIEGDEV